MNASGSGPPSPGPARPPDSDQAQAPSQTQAQTPAQTQSPVALGPASRVWRAAVLAAVGALFLAGSLIGQDDWWPFSPWRMYSTSQAPTGAVVSMSLEVRVGDGPWRETALSPQSLGLNRAEIEGRIQQITDRPQLLATLAASHARLRPEAPRWTAVRLVRDEQIIADRRPTGERRRIVLATWPAG
jgi:hypothetical protein